MNSPDRPIDPQLVYLDPYLVDRARLPHGWALKELAIQAEVDYRTVRDMVQRGAGVLPSKARDVADALKKNVLDLLAPWDPRYKPPVAIAGPWSGAAEWESTGVLDPGRLAPNGLYYIVCRMRHRHTAAKRGRGKFYLLSLMPLAKREGMRHQLTRHGDVCARVGMHPHIVVNHTSTPVTNDEGWWVIDDWVGEKTLADHLRAASWPREQLPRLLLEIARGLEVLHAAGVVFRELAPSRVLLSDKDGGAVLTDFELAKLLDGAPSVSSEWPEDPFRAPEVESGATTVRADLYSLGQLAAAALAGTEFDPGQAAERFGEGRIPKRLQTLLRSCVEPVSSRRPPTLAPLLKELSRWAEK